jgi:hypothetical protein
MSEQTATFAIHNHIRIIGTEEYSLAQQYVFKLTF